MEWIYKIEIWIGIISALATSIMAIATFITIRQNKKQLKEMKRQWEEEHRPKIELYMTEGGVNANKREIKLVNIGTTPARDVFLYIDNSWIKKIPLSDRVKNALSELGNAVPTFLFPNETQSFLLYKKEFEPGKYIYTIADVGVEEDEFNFFINIVSNFKDIPIKVTYNGKYDMEISVHVNRTRYSYSSINEAIDKVSNNIEVLNRMIHYYGVKINKENN